jgi:hypothetical protein
MIFCDRATRALRRPSLDARRWDHPSHPLKENCSLRRCGPTSSKILLKEAGSVLPGRIDKSSTLK